MSHHVTNKNFFDLVANENSKKASNTKNPFANNPSITNNEFFNPLENQNYSEILGQMSRGNPTSSAKTAKTPNLSDALNIAQSEIRNISKQLGVLRELASRAADRSQMNDVRNFLQKDFYGSLGNIDRSADNMNWNGTILTNGNSLYKIVQVDVQITTEKTSQVAETPTVIQNGDFSIDTDGVYTLPKDYSGTINVNAQNVKIVQEDPTTALNNVHIVGPENGNANLWLEGINVENSKAGDSIIKFSGENNVLSLKGENSLKTVRTEKAVINVGDGLTINAADDAVLNIEMYATNSGASISGAGIGSNNGQDSTADININGGTINVTMGSNLLGAAIGSGNVVVYSWDGTDHGSIGDININGSTINVKSGGTTVQGGAGIGAGEGAKCGNINIDNSKINAEAKSGAAIGAGAGNSVAGDINIGANTEIHASSRTGAGIGTGFSYYAYDRDQFSTVGTINIDSNAKVQASGIGAGENEYTASPGRVEDINYDPFSLDSLNVDVEEPTLGFITTTDTIQKNISFTNTIPLGPMIPQHNQHIGPMIPQHNNVNNQPVININLLNMHTGFLGTGNLFSAQGRFLNPLDQQRYDSFSGNSMMQNDWMEIVMGASNRRLNSLNIMSQRNAAIALRVIEGAIGQVQRELANISNYIQQFTAPSENTRQFEANTGNNYNYNGRFPNNFV